MSEFDPSSSRMKDLSSLLDLGRSFSMPFALSPHVVAAEDGLLELCASTQPRYRMMPACSSFFLSRYEK